MCSKSLDLRLVFTHKKRGRIQLACMQTMMYVYIVHMVAIIREGFRPSVRLKLMKGDLLSTLSASRIRAKKRVARYATP